MRRGGDKCAGGFQRRGWGGWQIFAPNAGIEVLPIPRSSWPGLTRPPRCRCGERAGVRWVPGSSPGMTNREGGAWGHPHPPQERSPLPARGRETQEPRAPSSPMAFQSAPSLPLAGRGNRRQAVGGGAPCAVQSVGHSPQAGEESRLRVRKKSATLAGRREFGGRTVFGVRRRVLRRRCGGGKRGCAKVRRSPAPLRR